MKGKHKRRTFQIALRLRDWYAFIWQSVEILNIFSILTFKQIFWKMETFFKKLDHQFLVESTNIENTSSPYKTTTTEANVKTDRMIKIKRTYHKEWRFASNYFIFLKTLFQFKKVLKCWFAVFIWCNLNAHIRTFC